MLRCIKKNMTAVFGQSILPVAFSLVPCGFTLFLARGRGSSSLYICQVIMLPSYVLVSDVKVALTILFVSLRKGEGT